MRGKAGECRQRGLLLAGGSLKREDGSGRDIPPSERNQHQQMRGNDINYQEQGILLGEDKRLPDVTPPLRLRTEVSGVEARGRGESVERAMERNRQGLWLSSRIKSSSHCHEIKRLSLECSKV